METQIAANIFCRGWLEPAYYYLGSDYRGGGGNAYTLTYMSQMGGWSVLDYGLHFAADPHEYLRLGYASYLSAWALMNTGTPESNYGYWYPGKANDGGAGGGFRAGALRTHLARPAASSRLLVLRLRDRSGILRRLCGPRRRCWPMIRSSAACVMAAIGRPRPTASRLRQRTVLRRRFHAMLNGGKPILTSTTIALPPRGRSCSARICRRFSSHVESDNPAEHTVTMRLSGLAEGRYVLKVGDGPDTTFEMPEQAGEISVG